MKNKKLKRSGPDSLESWVACLWCSLVGLVLFGMVRLSGMLFVASMEEFHVGREQASFPYVLCDVTQALISPVTGYFAMKFGTRPVLVFGCFLAAVGIGANFIASDIGTVTVFWGIVFGVGFGFCCPVLPIIITQHFVQKRATAIGIMYVGSYLGICVLPTILEFLIDTYGLKGTFLWLSAVTLHCVPAAMLLKKSKPGGIESTVPNQNLILRQLYTIERFKARKVSVDLVNLGTERRKSEDQFVNPVSMTPIIEGKRMDVTRLGNLTTNSSLASMNELQPQSRSGSLMIPPNIMFQPPVFCGDIFPVTSCDKLKSKINPSSEKVVFHEWRKSRILNDSTKPKPPAERISPMGAFKVFLEPVFVLVLLSNAVFICSFITFMTIVIDFAQDLGLPFSDGKYIILGFSIASNVGLMSFGWVTDGGYMSLSNFSGVVFFLRSLALAAMPFCNGFTMFLCVVMFQGLVEASIANVLPLIIADNYSEDVHGVAISCSFLLCGPVHLSIPSLISFFRDGWGSYDYLFYAMGGASFFCSALLFMAPLLAKCRCGRDETILKNKDDPMA